MTTVTTLAGDPPQAAPPSRRAFWLRVVLAGPLAFVCATLVMAGGALWLPKGAAQIDNLLLPILLFPAIWATLFFYACLAHSLRRAYLAIAAIGLSQLAMIGIHYFAR